MNGEEENKKADAGEGAGEGAIEPEGKAGEGASEPGEGAGSEAQKGETVNRHKHERDVARLREQIDAKDKELEGYRGLKDEFEKWKAEQEAQKVDDALKSAGCHDVVAARARLGEFDGDVDRLKEAAPYLFASADKSKRTGGNPKGQASGGDLDAKLDKAFGLA
ncbi:hypothetical protein GMI70_06940 [Eggerthellaceae bacterium zg-893]|nr:hypothetical protein [Eggerthellaceae bacterium zg-893]